MEVLQNISSPNRSLYNSFDGLAGTDLPTVHSFIPVHLSEMHLVWNPTTDEVWNTGEFNLSNSLGPLSHCELNFPIKSTQHVGFVALRPIFHLTACSVRNIKLVVLQVRWPEVEHSHSDEYESRRWGFSKLLVSDKTQQSLLLKHSSPPPFSRTSSNVWRTYLKIKLQW